MTPIWVALITATSAVSIAVISRQNTRQLRPNGGNSVADAVRRIDSTLSHVETRLETMDARQLQGDHWKESIDARLQALEIYHKLKEGEQ